VQPFSRHEEKVPMYGKKITIILILFLSVYLGRVSFEDFYPVDRSDTTTWTWISSFSVNYIDCIFIESSAKDLHAPLSRTPDLFGAPGSTGDNCEYRIYSGINIVHRTLGSTFRGVLHLRV
jgi:hypothetical protein